MGRWADQDSDAERLPEGFQRVGYDADTQTYTFCDANGRYYESDEGNRYGTLRPVGQPRPSPSPEETAAHNAQLEKGNKEAIRMMLPFALLVLVFLFLLFRYVNGGSGSQADDDAREQVHCGQGAAAIQVHQGETCWAIAEAGGWSVEALLGQQGNEGLDCDKLRVGQRICVPE